MIRAAFLGVVAGLLLAATAQAQQYLTQAAGHALACPTIQNQQGCAILWEKRFQAAFPGVVTRRGTDLKIKLLNGRIFTVDDREQSNNVIALAGRGCFLAIRRQYYEGNSWDILDRRTGKLTEIFGYPLFSPDGTHFVAATTDLDAQYSDTVLDVYDVTPDGIVRHFSALGGKPEADWGPGNVRWHGNDAIVFRMLRINDALDNDTGSRARLVRRHGRWSLITAK